MHHDIQVQLMPVTNLMFYSTFEVLDLPACARFRSDGNWSCCEVVLALSKAHPLCGPHLLRGVSLMPLFLSSETLCRPSSTVSVTHPPSGTLGHAI